jgi:hypothetical protein
VYTHFDIRGPRTGGSAVSYLCHFPRWLEQVELAPLKTRSWIMQERFLAPRVVHFSEGQTHWECGDLITSESVSDALYIILRTILTVHKSLGCCEPEALGQPLDILGRYRLWNWLMTSYSRGDLSFPTDRPIAITGLARALGHLIGFRPGDYTCGHWRSYFVVELMWTTQDSVARPLPNVPT